MPLYPLGISRRHDVPRVPEQSVGSVKVRWSLSGDLACVFIDAPHQPVPPMLHATLLDAICRRICVLPVRFGVALRDETEIRSLLSDRHHVLLGHLSRLDRTCEMGVRVATARSPCKSGASGDGHRSDPGGSQPVVPANQASALAYLEQRRSHYRHADEDVEHDHSIATQLIEHLRGCYRQWRRLPASPSYRLRLAFLVERDCVIAFQNRAQNVRNSHPAGQCVILGPWPPYSFVEEVVSEHLHADIGGA
jgi:hypothetical protein